MKRQKLAPRYTRSLGINFYLVFFFQSRQSFHHATLQILVIFKNLLTISINIIQVNTEHYSN